MRRSRREPLERSWAWRCIAALAPLGGLGALAVALLLAVGIAAADVAERIFGRADDGRIVIDEVVGQLASRWPLAARARARAPRCARGRLPRLPPLRHLEARAGALGRAELRRRRGVMLDDVWPVCWRRSASRALRS